MAGWAPAEAMEGPRKGLNAKLTPRPKPSLRDSDSGRPERSLQNLLKASYPGAPAWGRAEGGSLSPGLSLLLPWLWVSNPPFYSFKTLHHCFGVKVWRGLRRPRKQYACPPCHVERALISPHFKKPLRVTGPKANQCPEPWWAGGGRERWVIPPTQVMEEPGCPDPLRNVKT